MNVAITNEVIVIQYKNEIFRCISQIIQKHGHDLINLGKTGYLEQASNSVECIGKDSLQGSCKRANENARFIVSHIERKPCCRTIDRLYPLRDECRFTESSRSRYKGHPTTQP